MQQLQDAPLALLSFSAEFGLVWANRAAVQIDARLVPGVDVRLVFKGLQAESSVEWFASAVGTLTSNVETCSEQRVRLEIWRPQSGDGCYLCSITKESNQTAMETRRELLAEAADQAWESICITDADLNLPGPRLLYVNRGYEELFGFAEAEVLGKTPRIHQGPLTDKSVLNRLKNDLIAGRSFHGETINYRKNGEPFWLEWKICPVTNELGVVNRFISFQRDVTALKQARQRLDDFHSVLSHELRAPLASILGSLKLLKSFYETANEKQAKLLNIAVGCSERLTKLLDDLLDLSKLEAGEMNLKKVSVNVGDLLADSANSLETYQFGREIKYEIASTDAQAYVDRERIIQVLINLLSNAMKFSPSGGTVFLSAVRTDHRTIRFSVRDEGPGISKENQLKLFRKFQQLVPEDGTTRAGTGLGLAIADALVKEHGGKIKVESQVGQGTEFSFELEEVGSPKILNISGSFSPLQ